MSLVTYNGVILPYPFHSSFVERPLRDEEGDTDWYITELDISLQCVVNRDFLPQLVPDLTNIQATTNAAEIMSVVRNRLYQPRRQLDIDFDKIPLIPRPIDGNQGTVDARNGPKVEHCRILDLTNETFIIDFRIKTWRWENPKVLGSSPGLIQRNDPSNNVLYNRWTESATIDKYLMTKRTRNGSFVIRSDNPDGVTVAQMIPQMGVLGVPQGFLRTGSKYTVTPDGLKLRYEITDEEQYKMPPEPAYEARGYYQESSPRLARRYGESFVALRGSKTTSQKDLISAAIGVAITKLRSNATRVGVAAAGGIGIIEDARLRIQMYENAVDFSVRAMFRQTPRAVVNFDNLQGTAKNPIAAFGTVNTSTPGSDSLNTLGKVLPYTPSYPVRGTASRLLHAAAYYDPNLRRTLINQNTGQFNTAAALEPGEAGKTPE